MKLIDKDAFVAEIDRQIELLKPFLGSCAGQIVAEANNKLSVLEGLKSFLDTLEVKEVDLDFTKEVDVWVRDNEDTGGFFNVQELAKHFFELGLKAQKGE